MSKILIQYESDLIFVGLNNKEKRNALDKELMENLIEIFEKIHNDPQGFKAVVLHGEGKSFCAGADLNWMSQMVNYSHEENVKDSELLFNLFYAIYSCPLPVIVKAQGYVFGGGLGLLAAADYVLADTETLFSFSEVKLGLIPAVISSFVLTKCSWAWSRALMTSGEVFNFHQAFHLGLVQKELNDKNFNEILETYSQASQEALVSCKKLILKQNPLQPTAFKDLCVAEIARLRNSDEAQKRMKTFLDSKKGRS